MTIRPQTAPVLLQDLVRYTPPHIKAFKDVSESHCEHVYSTATERSSLPGLDERPGKDKIWKAETLCQKCRIHLILSVDFEDTLEQACPCEEFPVHHFILDEQVESVRAHSFRFRCSSPMCRAKLFTQLRAPVLSHIDQWVLTDTFVLKQKWEKCMDREEAEPYTPTKALKTFRSYIRGALSSDTPKRVPVNNKYFMLSLGDDATILLSKLGFSFEPVKDEASYPCWRLPGPAPYLDEEQRMQLQDVFDELLVLMQQRPDAEKQKAEEPAYRPPPGFKDMERVLGCLDCKSHPLVVYTCLCSTLSSLAHQFRPMKLPNTTSPIRRRVRKSETQRAMPRNLSTGSAARRSKAMVLWDTGGQARSEDCFHTPPN